MLPGFDAMANFDYKAFISYSHTDVAQARWLHRTLEAYRIPRRLVGQQGIHGPIPSRLQPIFRDRDELPAGNDLSEAVASALDRSEFLIVLCSPDAALSTWVNLEIETFIEHHEPRRVLCVIADRDDITSTSDWLPPALQAALLPGQEPIAADLRAKADGRRLARLKLGAGLIGIPLDQLVQRDAQRRHQRLLAISAASIVGMVFTGLLAFEAVDARRSEEQRRAEAEDLIEFMLGDLRNRLSSVGRLDIMDVVADKVLTYYAHGNLNDHADAALGRRARAFHLLGEVADLRGDMDDARASFDEAWAATGELLNREPLDPERIFNHAQSLFWRGYVGWRLGDEVVAEQGYRGYLERAEALVTMDADNPRWVGELGYASSTYGTFILTRSVERAITHFEAAIDAFRRAHELEPDNVTWQFNRAQGHAWLADAHYAQGSIPSATQNRYAEAAIYEQVLAVDPENQSVKRSLVVTSRAIAELALFRGQLDEAIEQSGGAVHLGDDVLAVDPDNTLSVHMNALAYLTMSEAQYYSGSRADADSALRAAESLAAELERRDRTVIEWQVLARRLDLQRAQLTLETKPSIGRSQINATASRLQTAMTEHPQETAFRDLLAEANHLLAVSSRDPAAARSHWQIVVDLLSDEPDLNARMLARLASAHLRLGNAHKARLLADRLAAQEFAHPGYRLDGA